MHCNCRGLTTAAFYCCGLLIFSTAATGTIHADNSSIISSDCNHCEPDAICVPLQAVWLTRKNPGVLEIHLPSAHRLAEGHQRGCGGRGGKRPRFVMIRGDLAKLAGQRPGGGARLTVSTGPRHDTPHPAGHLDDGSTLHLEGSALQPARCQNSAAGRPLPSPLAAARLCTSGSPAVVLQDVGYGASGLSMTCAFCPDTHGLASVTAVGPAPMLDVLLPTGGAAGDISIHLLVIVEPSDNDSGTCALKCDQRSKCVTSEQICDGADDCGDDSGEDESSAICPVLRLERSKQVKFTILLAIGTSVTVAALLTALVVVILAVRRWVRSRSAVKSDLHSLSLVDKAPLI